MSKPNVNLKLFEICSITIRAHNEPRIIFTITEKAHTVKSSRRFVASSIHKVCRVLDLDGGQGGAPVPAPHVLVAGLLGQRLHVRVQLRDGGLGRGHGQGAAPGAGLLLLLQLLEEC